MRSPMAPLEGGRLDLSQARSCPKLKVAAALRLSLTASHDAWTTASHRAAARSPAAFRRTLTTGLRGLLAAVSEAQRVGPVELIVHKTNFRDR